MTLKTPEQIAAMDAQFIYAAAHECHVTDVGADDPGLAETERAVRNLIEADRAQRSHVVTIQEEGYDRHAEARAILADWDRASIPNDRGLHNAGGFAMHNCVSIREAFRALLDLPASEETPEQIAERIVRDSVEGIPGVDHTPVSLLDGLAFGFGADLFEMLKKAARAGIQAERISADRRQRWEYGMAWADKGPDEVHLAAPHLTQEEVIEVANERSRRIAPTNAYRRTFTDWKVIP